MRFFQLSKVETVIALFHSGRAKVPGTALPGSIKVGAYTNSNVTTVYLASRSRAWLNSLTVVLLLCRLTDYTFKIISITCKRNTSPNYCINDK